MKKNLTVTMLACVAAIAVGCASASHGTKLNPDSVQKIRKGTTTKAEIEAMFGPPNNVAIIGDGRRMMHYMFHETKVNNTGGTAAMIGLSMIPIPGVGLAGTAVAAGTSTAAGSAGGMSSRKTRQQSLQIILNKDNVVEDYEFNDSGSDSKTGALGGTATTPTGPEKK